MLFVNVDVRYYVYLATLSCNKIYPQYRATFIKNGVAPSLKA
jgi:hypothetical protein